MPPQGDQPNLSPDTAATGKPDDPRSDIQQAVEARSDAVARGEGGKAGDQSPLAPDDIHDGNSGTGGVVKNQDFAQQ
jgi:hypothetical protein